ncbi:MAG: helix-turn-helix domain-containing protein [Gammaproteobacteria bacterium]
MFTNFRTIPDALGKPAFVVVPIRDYATLVAKARGTTRRRTIPHEVVRLMVDGFSAARAWREYRGLTQAAVARRLRITQPALAQIEASARPRKATREKLAKALGITVDRLPIR